MRLLTLPEQRQVEQLKKQVVELDTNGLDIHVSYNERELWLNMLTIVLETNDKMRTDWQSHHNPQSVRA